MIIVYSSLSGDYDEKIEDGRIYIEPSDKFIKHRMNAKIPKILPHKFLPPHEYSIWVDSNIHLKVEPQKIIEVFENPLCGVFAHPYRTTINEEIDACIELDSIKNLNYHKNKLGALAACGFIIRKNTEEVNVLNEKWMTEILLGSSRDQLSFPYTLGEISKKIQIKGSFTNNEYFKIFNHKCKNRNH
jgi:Protein of unknown function (DUF616)